MQFVVGPDSVKNYRRLRYTHWHALAEFVDNSTQAYLNNKEVLDKSFKDGETLNVEIIYDKENKLIRIIDNSIGMSESDLDRAMKLGMPPVNPNGRSQFGLGMKTAAFWLGDEILIRTKKLGDPTEYEVQVDIEKISNGETELDIIKTSKPLDSHYTYIEIRNLHDTVKGSRAGKIKRFLSSMYRVDIREKNLVLKWQNDSLSYDDSHTWAKYSDGNYAYQNLDFEINGKRVWGFVGVLEEGSRSLAGFSLMRYGRVIQGHPDAYRPESIFGQYLGSNNLVNQRLAGEIHLDAFSVSHTKDSIQFTEEEEELFQDLLLKESQNLINFARDRRKDTVDKGPSDPEKQVAVNKVADELNSKELSDNIQIKEDIPTAVLEAAEKPIIETTRSVNPTFTAMVGPTKLLVFISKDLTHFHPYYVVEQTQSSLIVVINDHHPFINNITDSEGYANYIRYCVYDALAEMKGLAANSFTPPFLRAMKDQLLRLPTYLEEYGSTSDTNSSD